MAERRRVSAGPPPLPESPNPRATAVLGGVNVFIGILLIVQMWLLTASLESLLEGHGEVALPGAVVSGVLFIGCLSLGRFIDRADRRSGSG